MTTPVATEPHADQARPSVESELAAFRELHGTRLQAFATLVTVGDGPLAAALVADALLAAAHHADDLQHPERAAAWLRHHVTKGAMRRRPADLPQPAAEWRHSTLREMRISRAAQSGLEALPVRERAALVAAELEGLEPLDVGVVTGQRDQQLWKTLSRARLHFAEAFANAWDQGRAPVDGPLATRVREAAGIPVS
jgi:DNA-directed RNA polymerase specialized sigma24 family protein